MLLAPSHPSLSLPGKFLQMPPSPGSLLHLLGDPPFHCALLEPSFLHTVSQVLGLRTPPTPPTPRSSGSWSQLCCPASEATVSAFSPMVRQGQGRPTVWRWEGETLGGSWGQGLGCESDAATPPCPQGPPEDPGIAPRALQSLYQEMGTGGQHRVTLSMVEIYNEAVRSGPCYSTFSSACVLPVTLGTSETKPFPFSPGTS